MKIKSVGDYIKVNYLDKHNWDISYLADKLATDRATFSKLINNQVRLSVDVAIRLSKVLGRTPQWWLNMQAEYHIDDALKNNNYKNLINFRKDKAFRFPNRKFVRRMTPAILEHNKRFERDALLFIKGCKGIKRAYAAGVSGNVLADKYHIPRATFYAWAKKGYLD